MWSGKSATLLLTEDQHPFIFHRDVESRGATHCTYSNKYTMDIHRMSPIG